MTSSNILIWAIVLHLIADWMFQNEWIAINKANLCHPAGWVHGVVHLVFMLPVFPWYFATLIAMSHILIDTRIPTRIWMQRFKQTQDGPYKVHVSIWLDQVFHIAILALASWVVAVKF